MHPLSHTGHPSLLTQRHPRKLLSKQPSVQYSCFDLFLFALTSPFPAMLPGSGAHTQLLRGRHWPSLVVIQSSHQFPEPLMPHLRKGWISFLIHATSNLVWFQGSRTPRPRVSLCESADSGWCDQFGHCLLIVKATGHISTQWTCHVSACTRSIPHIIMVTELRIVIPREEKQDKMKRTWDCLLYLSRCLLGSSLVLFAFWTRRIPFICMFGADGYF